MIHVLFFYFILMWSRLNISNVLFLDIECVPRQSSFFDLSEGMKALREKKANRLSQSSAFADATPDELYDNRSGIYAEWWKIIVISVWFVGKNDVGERTFRVKSFSGDDEAQVLSNFFDLLNTHFDKSFHKLCGHNIREFDVPYICRRAMVHGLQLPTIIDVSGKKPWEVGFIDTMELWKCGDRKSFVSLDLLCRVMWIDTPKDDISWEQVARVYWDEQDIARIQTYCEKDVIATAQLLMKMIRREDDLGAIEIVR